MKNNISIISVLIGICLLASCNVSSGKSNAASSSAKFNPETIDSINQRLDVLKNSVDSLSKVNASLNEDLKISRDSVAVLQEKVVKLERPKYIWICVSVGAAILAILSLILLLLLPKFLYEKKVLNVFHEYLDQSTRINEMKQKIDDLASRVNPNIGNKKKSGANVSDLENKINEIVDAINRHERMLDNANAISCNPSVNTYSGHHSSDSYFSRIGYAKLNSGLYFFDILDSNQEGCVFCIKFCNDTKGEFDLISLDKIKSRNNWQDVVECYGDCTIDEANKYNLIECGVCERYSDGKTWEVKRKLKIKLHK